MQHFIIPYYLPFICLLFFPCFLFANTTIPTDPQTRSDLIDQNIQTAKKELRTNAERSFAAALRAKELSANFDESKWIASNICIGQVYQQRGMLDSAFQLTQAALSLARDLGNDALQADAHHSLGMNYQFAGRIELAMEHYHNALKINENLDRYQEQVRQLNNIGLLYREEGQYELALEYLEKCLKICKEKNYSQFEFYSYGNIGYILMKQNKLEEALERYYKTLELKYAVADTVSYCTINYLIADVKLQQRKLIDAKRYAAIALNTANHIDYTLGKVFCKRVLSDIYRHEKNYGAARATAQEAVKLVKASSAYLYYEDVLNVLFRLEYETGNYQKALDYQLEITNRKDSLMTVETKEKIANSEYKYQLLKNKQENQILKIKNESSHRTMVWAIIVTLLALLLVFISLFAYRKSKGYNETLEKAIEARTRELEESNRHLAKSNEELERFAYIASHDLKTPLRNIVSFTGLLERQLASHEDEKVHDYLSFIKKGGKRLNDLIIDTLEYSRLSAFDQNGPTEVIHLDVLLSDVKKSLSNYIETRNAKIIQLHPLPLINANASSMILLFQNLVDNSIKYNESLLPTIKIYSEKRGEYFSLFFEDNGIGIPQEYQDEIFVMFSRLHNQDEYEGSGLGLAICKKVVENLRGEIYLQSEHTKGSTFEVRFPNDILVEETIGIT
ncbi:MAG: tetratricopeptide repeat protein [Bacteroidota bacterium]